MSARVLAAVSLLANVALVVVALRAGRTSTASEEEVHSGRTATVEATRVRTNVTRVEVTLTNEAAPFHWRDVQAEDFKAYAGNLRSIGCPPETVRDIIEGEINDWFLARRRAVLEPWHRGYWELVSRAKDMDDVTEPYEDLVEKLNEEREARIKAALATSAERTPPERREPKMDYLSDAADAALREANRKFDAEWRKVRDSERQRSDIDWQATREKLEAARKDALRAAMTPAEFAEHELRASRYADTAKSAAGFEASVDEMKSVARVYEQFKAADARPDRKDPDAAAKRAQAEEWKRQREAALRQTLGEERFAQFQEGQNGRFQEIYKITSRYDLPREIASQAAAIFRTRNETLQQLRADKTMPTEERPARVVAMQAELRAALLQTMGERALGTYEKYHGPIVPNDPPENR